MLIEKSSHKIFLFFFVRNNMGGGKVIKWKLSNFPNIFKFFSADIYIYMCEVKMKEMLYGNRETICEMRARK